jgi:hypothetical protein
MLLTAAIFPLTDERISPILFLEEKTNSYQFNQPISTTNSPELTFEQETIIFLSLIDRKSQILPPANVLIS